MTSSGKNINSVPILVVRSFELFIEKEEPLRNQVLHWESGRRQNCMVANLQC